MIGRASVHSIHERNIISHAYLDASQNGTPSAVGTPLRLEATGQDYGANTAYTAQYIPAHRRLITVDIQCEHRTSTLRSTKDLPTATNPLYILSRYLLYQPCSNTTMSCGGRSSGRGRGNAGRSDSNNRGSGSSSTPYSSSPNGKKSENRESDSPNIDTEVVPTSIASWVIGITTGHDENRAWYLKYMETAIFKKACELFKKKTGVNLAWSVAVIVGMMAEGTFLPSMATSVFRFYRTQVTSSITPGPNDAALKEGLLKSVRDSAVKPNESWLAFRGHHVVSCPMKLPILQSLCT
jgi:hypothetical protein